MKKFLKWLLGLAAVGTGIGLIIAYFCKDSDAVSEYDCTEDMEEDLAVQEAITLLVNESVEG